MSFDPDAFINMQFEETPPDKYEPVPEGEYHAVIERIGEPRLTQNGSVVLDIYWSIQEPELLAKLERDTAVVRQSLWLDVGSDGRLLFGKNKNVQLGRLLKAVGIDRGQPWSFQSLVGRSALITVRHRTTDEGEIYENVTRVASSEDMPF